MQFLAAASGGMGNYTILIFFVLMIVLMYFTMYRPQKKQQEKRQKMLNAIKVGDPVVTIGGLHGTIDELDDANQTVVLDCDGIYLTFSRSAIRTIAKTKQQPAATNKTQTTTANDSKKASTPAPEDDSQPAPQKAAEVEPPAETTPTSAEKSKTTEADQEA